MKEQEINETVRDLVDGIREVLVDIRDLFVAFGEALRSRSTDPLVKWFMEGSVMDPAHVRRTVVRILKILILVELISAFFQGLGEHDWSRFGTDLVIAGVLYVLWDRITSTLREKKDEYRKKMDLAPDTISLWNALIFSLLWSDEIYAEIPPDRRRLVVISYTLIALGVLAAFVNIGTGMMVLVVSGALVLGAVNLATWVISLERGEKENLRTELRLARDVQVSLMPKGSPSLAGFEIAGMSLPAQEVGGDHFDFFHPGSADGLLGISVVDVSGKGMQAAMSAVFISGAFASESKQSASPADILTRLNRTVYSHSRRGQFIAFLLAVVDPARRCVTYANAGQTKPLLFSRGSLRWLDSVGIHFPLGMQAESVYQEAQISVGSGDILFLLTDGFTEAMNATNEVFGTERIEQTLGGPGVAALPAERILDLLTKAVRAHAGDVPQHDDMTMVVVKAR